MSTPEPFTIDLDVEDLRHRIAATRWPDELPGSGWDYGTDLGYLRGLLTDWAAFDWDATQRELNQLSHFRANGIHFVHERGHGPHPLPLVLTHGWPSSFVEYLDLIPLLTDPPDPADAFDVVVPSLPGYGFSDRPAEPGLAYAEIADRWRELMTGVLGYERFGAQGSDIGGGVTALLARRHPEQMVGVHLSAVGFAAPPEPWTPAERDYFAAVQRWGEDEGAYSQLQRTKPQTLGYGLTDSPAGLAAWIAEKFRAWSDSGGVPDSAISRERLITNLTIYWATSTITSSTRLYYEQRVHAQPPATGERPPVPAGFAMFGNEFASPGRPPRELAERYYRVERWRELPRGGHFPAIEQPELLAEEIRAFFRPLR